MMNQEPFNPYAAPRSEIAAPPTSDIEAARRLMLNHEASVKSIGALFILGALFLVFAGGVSAITVEASAEEATMTRVVGALFVALGVFQFWVALGLRKLNPKARGPAILLSALGLVAIPIGTIISIYMLYLLGSAKGRTVFSAEYAQVIAATPHIKYRSSLVMRIFLWLILALIVLGVLLFLFTGR